MDKLKDNDNRGTITNNVDDSIFVEAAAGSGKTFSMVQRIVNAIKSEKQIDEFVAITFTEKAGQELKSRIRKKLTDESDDNEFCRNALLKLDSAAIGTIHSFCLEILRMNFANFELPPKIEILGDLDEVDDLDLLVQHVRENTAIDDWKEKFYFTSKDEYYCPNCGKIGLSNSKNCTKKTDDEGNETGCGYSTNEDKNKNPGFKVRKVLHETKTLNSDNIRDFIVGIYYDTPRSLDPKKEISPGKTEFEKLINAVYQAIEEYVQNRILEKAQMTYNDILNYTLIKLKKCQIEHRYNHFIIDEFQDTDPTQYEIIKCLLEGKKNTTLTVVGDPKQAIYHFRGGDISTYLKARTEKNTYKNADLSVNFRTIEPVLKFSDEFFGNKENGIMYLDQRDHAADVCQSEYTNFEVSPRKKIVYDTLLSGSEPMKNAVTIIGQEAVDKDDDHKKAFRKQKIKLDSSYLARSEAASIAQLFKDSKKYKIPDNDKIDEIKDDNIFEDTLSKNPESFLRSVKYSDMALLIPTKTRLDEYREEFDKLEIPYQVEIASDLYQVQEVINAMNLLKYFVTNEKYYLLLALRSSLFAISDEELFDYYQPKYEQKVNEKTQKEYYAPSGKPSDLLQNALEIIKELRVTIKTQPVDIILSEVFSKCYSFESVTKVKGNKLSEATKNSYRLYNNVIKFATSWWSDNRKIMKPEVLKEETDNNGNEYELLENHEQVQKRVLKEYLKYVDNADKFKDTAKDIIVADDGGDAVLITNIHQSKGREWAIVAVGGGASNRNSQKDKKVVLTSTPKNKFKYQFMLLDCNVADDKDVDFNVDYEIPKTSGYDEALELEKKILTSERVRLFYVAYTRAQYQLIVSAVHQSRKFDEVTKDKPLDPPLYEQRLWVQLVGQKEERETYFTAVKKEKKEKILPGCKGALSEEYLAEKTKLTKALVPDFTISSKGKGFDRPNFDKLKMEQAIKNRATWIELSKDKSTMTISKHDDDMTELGDSKSWANPTNFKPFKLDFKPTSTYNVFGTAVHRVLELSKLEATQIDRCISIAVEEGKNAEEDVKMQFKEPDVAVLKEAALGVINSDLSVMSSAKEALQSGRGFYPELAMLYKTDKGKSIVASADLVFEAENGDLVIIDWKNSVNVDKNTLDKYAEQLFSYAHILENDISKRKVSKVALVFCLPAGEPKEVIWEKI